MKCPESGEIWGPFFYAPTIFNFAVMGTCIQSSKIDTVIHVYIHEMSFILMTVLFGSECSFIVKYHVVRTWVMHDGNSKICPTNF